MKLIFHLIILSFAFQSIVIAGVKSITPQLDFTIQDRLTSSMNHHQFQMNGNIHVTGSYSQSVGTAMTSGNIGDHNLVLAIPTSEDIVLTLPYSGNAQGRILSVKKTNINYDVSVEAVSGDNIDGMTGGVTHTFPSLSKSLAQFVSDGTQWYQLSEAELEARLLVSSTSTLNGAGNITVTSTTDEIYLTLPDPAQYNGETIIVNLDSSANLTFVEADGANISGWPIQEITAGNAMTFGSDGANWSISADTKSSDNVVAQSNLLAWWSFDDSNNNITSLSAFQDSSGGGHHLTPDGLVSDNIAIDGVLGRAVALGNVGLDSAGIIGAGEEAVTFSFWCYTSQTGAKTKVLFNNRNGHSGGIAIELWTTNRVAVKMTDGASYAVTTVTSLPVQQWVHYVVTYHSGTIKIFANNVLVSTDAGFLSTLGTPRSVSMYRQTYSSGSPHSPCDGEVRIDDFRVYDFELNVSQIDDIYQKGVDRL